MRSFARSAAAAAFLAALACAPVLRAQTPEVGYNEAIAREAELRQDLDRAPQAGPTVAPAPILVRVRSTVTSFENIVRQFPRSGYSDDALWHGAVLSADAYWQFGEARDRLTAIRLLDLLVSQYPLSRFVKQAPEHRLRLSAATAPAKAAPSTPPSSLRAVRREVLGDTVRVTLDLEREAAFREERIDGPPRLLFDLQNTRAVDALRDATLTFPDDAVRQIRVGRQIDGRTRIAFDLAGSPRYSVYSLYNPYRLVIDFERPAGQAPQAPQLITRTLPPAPAAAPAPRPPAPAPPTAPTANTQGGFSLSRQLGLGIARVVIDPGHGGHDPGALVKGQSSEAELVLDVAKRLEKLLLKQQGVEVILTRSSDVFVPLETRTEIANRAEADLFLSIHANASSDTSARGFETYFLSFAPNAQAEAIAARENAASARTMRSLPDIVKAIALNNKIDESRDFAAMVQGAMADSLKKVDRRAKSLGVKQAPFMVLIGATMPSVLAEISFLTNRDEGALLKTANYRQRIAESLLAGIMRYQKSLKTQTIASQ